MAGKKYPLICSLLLFCLLFVSGTGLAQIKFDIAAEAGLLMEPASGQILFAKNIDEKFPPASLAKIMTMLLVMEAVDTGRARLDDTITVSERAESMGGSQVWLAEGEQFTLGQLMEAIAIQSANDATVAVAEYLAGSEETFVDAMNQRAQELGMKNTLFINTNGLPEGEGEDRREGYTTARDVAILARELLKYPKVLEWTQIWRKEFRDIMMTNTNPLVKTYEGCDGLKTGHTDTAGYHLVATAQRDDMRLLSVVMKADSKETREIQSARLLDYGFRAFKMMTVLENGTEVGEVVTKNGNPEKVTVKAARDLKVLVEKGREDELTTELVYDENLSAPLAPGAEVGEVVVKIGETELGRIPVETPVRVNRAGFFTRIYRWFRDLFAALFGGS